MLQIGNIPIAMPAVQAALSGYSDAAMRRVAREHGAKFCFHEVVLDKEVLTKGKSRQRALMVPEGDHPIGGQLMGAVPETFAEAASDMVEAGYDVIDINFGCPVNKALGRCRGGYHLSQPPVALDIVARVVDAVAGRTPVSLKMRRGIDDSAEAEGNFFRILDGAFELGIAAVTVHGRTVVQKYVGPSNWDFLARVKKHLGDRTMLGSGDLFDAESVRRMMEHTGVDGVTLARGCIGNPWLFEQTAALLEGRRAEPPTVQQQGDAIVRHWRYAEEFLGKVALRKLRTHAIKYAQLHPQAERVRDAFVGAKSEVAMLAVLAEFYGLSVPAPPPVAAEIVAAPTAGES